MEEIYYKNHFFKICYLRKELLFIFLVRASLRIETLYEKFMFFLDRCINNCDSKKIILFLRLNIKRKISYEKKCCSHYPS